MAFEYERELIDYINSLKVSILARPLILGGTTGSNGGNGGPPGGFIGQLPQSKVTYDTTEAETLNPVTSGLSLVDNLNTIRYRVAQLEVVTFSGFVAITVSAIEPTAPSFGDLWVDIS